MTERERLLLALSQVERLTAEHWCALDEACRLMANHAWIGPTARAFGAEQLRRRSALRAALRESADLVRQRLARIP